MKDYCSLRSHVWPFQFWQETDKAAYLLRQYFFIDLHDRFSTRPFLSLVEKKWLAFKLLLAVKQCHEKNICHGDIKCENVLVTSWNWLYLSDFASFKPTYIPYDDPSDFSFFFDTFDTRGLRLCYLAPLSNQVKMAASDISLGGTSQPRRRRFFGLPDKCWCGSQLATKTSTIGKNPYRRYFKCAFAASNLVNEEEHILKWIDQALIEEVESNNLLEAEERRLITLDINKIKSECEANSLDEAEHCRLIMDNINQTKTACESKFAELRHEINQNYYACEKNLSCLRREVSKRLKLLMGLIFIAGFLIMFCLKNMVK